MKKTLIALAAVAVSTGAMAQATISGVLDVGAMTTVKKTDTASNGAVTTTKTNNTADNAGRWATSELRIGGTEDLGNGLKASFQLNSDLRGDTPGFVNRDRWLQLAGGFGSIRIGSQGNVGNSAGFNAYNQFGTTGTGSNYGLLIGPSGTERIERQHNVINYTSPNFNGVTVMVGTARNSVDKSEVPGKVSTKQDGLSVTYAAGPLRAGFGTTNRTINTEHASTASETKVKANFVGASYNFGVATVGGSVASNKASSAGVNSRDLSLTTVGVTVPMGAITLRATTFTGKDKKAAASTDDVKHTGNQLSVTYALSKRTQIYAYTGKTQEKSAGSNTSRVATKTTGTHVGLTHSF